MPGGIRKGFISGAAREKLPSIMKREQALDLYFIDARSKLIDLAAFLDRAERSPGADDFRLAAFREALKVLGSDGPEKARRVLLAFSDPTQEPLAAAPGKSACGAWPGKKED